MKPIRLLGPSQRAYAKAQIDSAEDGWIVTLREPTRSLDQNARLWAMLGDVARAEPMGRKHTPDDWKAVFMRECGWEVAFLPSLSGDFFPIGFRSSQLTVRQMADLITWIMAWGDEQGIRWSEPHPDERAA
jgi:hypothetical protein